VVAKSPEAAAKKSTSSRASKRLKKAAVASVSLDTHRLVGSTDGVSITFLRLALLLFELFFSCLPFDRL
jgi:hypothetical protein